MRAKTGIMALGPKLREQYEADRSLTTYDLARHYGCSHTTIHRSLVAAGTKMRPSGGDRKSRQTKGLLGWVNS